MGAVNSRYSIRGSETADMEVEVETAY